MDLKINQDYVYNLQIGNHCAIAHDNKCVIDITHNYNCVYVANVTGAPSNLGPIRKGQLLIQNDVWIGRGATLMGGVTIHNGAVIAAGSVVVKDVAPYSIVGGNPAKHIKYRFDEKTIEQLQMIQWWYWDKLEIEKNLSFFSTDIAAFVNQFYPQAKENFEAIKAAKLEVPYAKRRYLYFLDVSEAYATWPHVISEFVKAFFDDASAMLILFVAKGETNCLSLLEAQLADVTAKCNIFVFFGDEQEELSIFACADYYISNRTAKVVFHSCMADLFHVKKLSGVDIPIFR